jgi:hypothetical protein
VEFIELTKLVRANDVVVSQSGVQMVLVLEREVLGTVAGRRMADLHGGPTGTVGSSNAEDPTGASAPDLLFLVETMDR